MPDKESVETTIAKLTLQVTELLEKIDDLENETSSLQDEIDELTWLNEAQEKELNELDNENELVFLCDLIKDTCADANIYLGYTGTENEVQHATALLKLLGEKAKKAPS